MFLKSQFFSIFQHTHFDSLLIFYVTVPCLVAEKIEDKWGGRNVVTVQMLLFCFDNWKTLTTSGIKDLLGGKNAFVCFFLFGVLCSQTKQRYLRNN